MQPCNDFRGARRVESVLCYCLRFIFLMVVILGDLSCEKIDPKQKQVEAMSEWKRCIISFHKLDHSGDPGSLVLGEPATAGSIGEFERSIGYSMPDEFKAIYSEFDGFGAANGGTIDWFFVPLARLPDYVSEVRDWFQVTHPEVAKRFVPFGGWESGDAIGYIFSDEGVPDPGIFIFEHENYEFNEGQDWREFIIPVSSSIHDFFPK